MNERTRVVILVTLAVIAIYLATQKTTRPPALDGISQPAMPVPAKPLKKRLFPFIRPRKD